MVIVGGGFAGLACARKLAKSQDVRVTLIDRNNFHQFQPLFYQVAAAELGTGDVATSLRQCLRGHPNVDVKMAEVVAADPHTRTVTTREARPIRETFWCWRRARRRIFSIRRGRNRIPFPCTH